MRKIRGEHPYQGESHRPIAGERDPESAGRLSLQKVSLARGLVQYGLRGVTLEELRRCAFDGGQAREILQPAARDAVSGIDGSLRMISRRPSGEIHGRIRARCPRFHQPGYLRTLEQIATAPALLTPR